MNPINQTTMLTISEANLEALIETQNEILQMLKDASKVQPVIPLVTHITAKEFMEAVRIKRTKFDQLVQEGKVRVVKKKRKIYVPTLEVNRYFTDPNIG